jgi:hypothetical protein
MEEIDGKDCDVAIKQNGVDVLLYPPPSLVFDDCIYVPLRLCYFLCRFLL